MKTSANYSMGVWVAALALMALPLAASAKTVATPALSGSLQVAAPLGADLSAATDQSMKVARRMIRRSFRAPQRGGWRTIRSRNRHGGVSTNRSFRNVHSRSGRFRSFRRNRNLHGGFSGTRSVTNIHNRGGRFRGR